jgi:hypothetical protein
MAYLFQAMSSDRPLNILAIETGSRSILADRRIFEFAVPLKNLGGGFADRLFPGLKKIRESRAQDRRENDG